MYDEKLSRGFHYVLFFEAVNRRIAPVVQVDLATLFVTCPHHLLLSLSLQTTLRSGRHPTNSGLAMSVGMALLVVYRLALMRGHWTALNASVQSAQNTEGSSVKDNRPDSCPPGRGEGIDAGSAKAVDAVSAVGSKVMESGVFLLALEASAMLWVVGGWSSLVAVRFR